MTIYNYQFIDCLGAVAAQVLQHLNIKGIAMQQCADGDYRIMTIKMYQL